MCWISLCWAKTNIPLGAWSVRGTHPAACFGVVYSPHVMKQFDWKIIKLVFIQRCFLHQVLQELQEAGHWHINLTMRPRSLSLSASTITNSLTSKDLRLGCSSNGTRQHALLWKPPEPMVLVGCAAQREFWKLVQTVQVFFLVEKPLFQVLGCYLTRLCGSARKYSRTAASD